MSRLRKAANPMAVNRGRLASSVRIRSAAEMAKAETMAAVRPRAGAGAGQRRRRAGQGAAAAGGPDTVAGARLAGMRDFYLFVQEAMPEVLDKWAERKRPIR
jgi:hypothetical protein